MSRRSVCTMVVVAALSFWLGTPAWAQQSSLSLNLGYFALRGEDTRISDDVTIEHLGLFAFGLAPFNNAYVWAEWFVRFRRAGGGRGNHDHDGDDERNNPHPPSPLWNA